MIRVMVRDGENKSEVVKKFGGGVLGLSWVPSDDKIIMNLRVNISQKRANVRSGPDLNLNTMGKLDMNVVTQRVWVSQTNSIYGPMGFLPPIITKFKWFFQKVSSLEYGWDDPLDKEIALELR